MGLRSGNSAWHVSLGLTQLFRRLIQLASQIQRWSDAAQVTRYTLTRNINVRVEMVARGRGGSWRPRRTETHYIEPAAGCGYENSCYIACLCAYLLAYYEAISLIYEKELPRYPVG